MVLASWANTNAKQERRMKTYTRRKKQSTGSCIIMSLVALALLGVGAFFWPVTEQKNAVSGQKAVHVQTSPASDEVSWAELVPPLPDDDSQGLLFRGAEEAEIPVVTPERIKASFGQMLAYKKHPNLQTAYDRDAMVLAEKYASGEMVFRLIEKTSQLYGAKAGVRSTMMYDVDNDRFAYRRLQLTDQMLVVVVYHELAHKVDSDRKKAGKSFMPQCYDEPIAGYSAQVRMLSAIMTTSQLPTRMGGDDAGVLGMTMEAWPAFVSQHFCEWYGNYLQKGEVMGSGSPVTMEEVKQ